MTGGKTNPAPAFQQYAYFLTNTGLNRNKEVTFRRMIYPSVNKYSDDVSKSHSNDMDSL